MLFAWKKTVVVGLMMLEMIGEEYSTRPWESSFVGVGRRLQGIPSTFIYAKGHIAPPAQTGFGWK